MQRDVVVSNFLRANTLSDLSNLYNRNMQAHVLVGLDSGTKEGTVVTDGIETWYPFVINSEEDCLKQVTYNFDSHVEAIGLTGWDWKNQASHWVAFDFDSLLNHKSGLSEADLKEIQSKVFDIDWITIRKSTSGKGLHLYVFLNPVIPTSSRSEHSALARAILHKLTALTGINFKDKVDVCGGNMFIWHRKMKGTDGLSIIKQGQPLTSIPNWQEQVTYVQNNKPIEREFDELVGSKVNKKFDLEHQRLTDWLQKNDCKWWWDNDKHILICHTFDLAVAHKDLGLKGVFKTIATGKDHPDHNCFAYPISNGGWVIRRYGRGATEDPLWFQDEGGWTKCYYNVDSDLTMASRCYGGLEHPNGSYVFKTTEEAMLAASSIGVHFKLPLLANYCGASIKEQRDGRVIISIEDKEHKIAEADMPGWIYEKFHWKKIFTKPRTASITEETTKYDEIIRHLISPTGEDCGWAIKTNTGWNFESLQHVKLALESMSLDSKSVKNILGSNIMQCWKLINMPFKPEYPGDRKWNLNAAKLKYIPDSNVFEIPPTWSKVLEHIGESLTPVLRTNEWAKSNKIYTGADYLVTWIASMFQEPTEPLPYLFLYGPQNSGKSILHEALSLLLIGGYVKADNALINKSGFNAELESAVLCVVEEINLGRSREAANRIKDWVTARDIVIHKKMKTPYMINNVTHWMQMSNDHDACPVFSGDTRVVVLFVNSLTQIIPKRDLINQLELEAKSFLGYIMNLQLPKSYDRLNVPVITTSEKDSITQSNKSLLEMFISENCYQIDGHMIKFSDFYNKFIEWLGPTTEFWSKQKVGRELPPSIPRGRIPNSGQFYVGNLTFEKDVVPMDKIILKGDCLYVKSDLLEV